MTPTRKAYEQTARAKELKSIRCKKWRLTEKGKIAHAGDKEKAKLRKKRYRDKIKSSIQYKLMRSEQEKRRYIRKKYFSISESELDDFALRFSSGQK